MEQHVGILLEDLSALGTATDLSHSEKMVLEEAFLGLHYVWRMRVHDNLRNLDPRLCERLRLALVQFLGRVSGTYLMNASNLVSEGYYESS